MARKVLVVSVACWLLFSTLARGGPLPTITSALQVSGLSDPLFAQEVGIPNVLPPELEILAGIWLTLTTLASLVGAIAATIGMRAPWKQIRIVSFSTLAGWLTTFFGVGLLVVAQIAMDEAGFPWVLLIVAPMVSCLTGYVTGWLLRSHYEGHRP